MARVAWEARVGWSWMVKLGGVATWLPPGAPGRCPPRLVGVHGVHGVPFHLGIKSVARQSTTAVVILSRAAPCRDQVGLNLSHIVLGSRSGLRFLSCTDPKSQKISARVTATGVCCSSLVDIPRRPNRESCIATTVCSDCTVPPYNPVLPSSFLRPNHAVPAHDGTAFHYPTVSCRCEES